MEGSQTPKSFSWTPALGSAAAPPVRTYQGVLNATCVAQLESQLKDYVWSIPHQGIPTYSKAPSPPSSTRHLQTQPRDLPYSRSAVQRYIMQELAVDLHGPEEKSRVVHDFGTFRDALKAPETADLERIHPHVEDIVQKQESQEYKPADTKGDVFAPPQPHELPVVEVAKVAPVPSSPDKSSVQQATPAAPKPPHSRTHAVIDMDFGAFQQSGECLVYYK